MEASDDGCGSDMQAAALWKILIENAHIVRMFGLVLFLSIMGRHLMPSFSQSLECLIVRLVQVLQNKLLLHFGVRKAVLEHL